MTVATRTMTLQRGIVASVLVAVATAMVLLAMGRSPIAASGVVKLWHGVVQSSENSQHLTDWYTPSHLLHGLVLYAATHVLLGRFGVGWRLLVATLAEAAWEIAENTDAVIERYREATIALDYFGDSVLNSMADIAAMWAGFALARVLPVWASVALFVVAEAVVMFFIRDGLLLNVLMLVWPLEAVRQWQAGG